MDQFYQIMYGPVQDKLKYAGTVWLGLSLVAQFGRADLGGFIGLLAILAVLHTSLYLLRLTLVTAPLSLIVGIAYFIGGPKGLAYSLLQLVHFVVQGATIWWAWQWHQELGGTQDGYDVPRDSPPQQARTDPFQAYVPPPSAQQSTIYAPEHQQSNQQPQHPEQPRSNGPQYQKEEGPRGENLL